MPTKPKSRLKPERPAIPVYISKPEMAETLRCNVVTIGEWVEEGHFPPPWLVPGPSRQISLWRLDHFLYFNDHGQWPEEAWGRTGASDCTRIPAALEAASEG